MEFLLYPEDLEKVHLVESLLKLPTSSVELKKLQQTLELSTYKTKKLLMSLVADIEEFNLQDEVPLIFCEETQTIELEHKKPVNVALLKAKYLVNSILYKLLRAMWLEELTSIQDFADKNFVSSSQVFEVKKRLMKILESREISISDDYKLIGVERNVRVFVYELLYANFNIINISFLEEFCEEAAYIMELMEPHLTHPFSEAQKIQFTYLYGVGAHRLKQGHYVMHGKTREMFKDYSQLPVQSKHIVDGIMEYLMTRFGMTHEEAAYETHFIAAWFYSSRFDTVSGMKNDLLPSRVAEIEQVIQLEMDYFKEFFGMAPSQNLIDTVSRDFFVLNFRLLYFHQYGFSKKIDSTFYRKHYPLITEFVINLVNKIAAENTKNEQEYADFCRYLFFDVLTVYINYLTPPKFGPRVKIYLDFPNIIAREEFLQERILSYRNLHVEFQDELTEDTDITLSEIRLPILNPKTTQFIWQSPPNEHEWAKFENITVNIAYAKFQIWRATLKD